jgi:erythromycin esterase-like protein
MRRRRLLPTEPQEGARQLAQRVARLALPLEAPGDLDPLLERIGNARYVLLGEASHGTSEYYRWRARISQRLIREKGFSFIAVEGDWPDCYRVNRYVRGLPDAGNDAREVLESFTRWPTWMWANEEIVVLAEWLRRHNAGLAQDRKVGFFGLDVYSLWDSLYAVLGYLRKADPSLLPAARRALRCFQPYGEDVQQYARATALVPASCEEEVVALLKELRCKGPQRCADGREEFFTAEQNALVVKNAEAYYRAMVRGGPESWNIRDRHMTETLERLMRHHGPDAKAIVWEHNTQHWRCPLHGHGRRRHGERRPAGAGAPRGRRGVPGRVRVAPRQRDRRQGLGGADGTDARSTGAGGELGGRPSPGGRGRQAVLARRRSRR